MRSQDWANCWRYRSKLELSSSGRNNITQLNKKTYTINKCLVPWRKIKQNEGPDWAGKGWQVGGWLVTQWSFPTPLLPSCLQRLTRKNNHLPSTLAAGGGHINIIFSGHWDKSKPPCRVLGGSWKKIFFNKRKRACQECSFLWAWLSLTFCLCKLSHNDISAIGGILWGQGKS